MDRTRVEISIKDANGESLSLMPKLEEIRGAHLAFVGSVGCFADLQSYDIDCFRIDSYGNASVTLVKKNPDSDLFLNKLSFNLLMTRLDKLTVLTSEDRYDICCGVDRSDESLRAANQQLLLEAPTDHSGLICVYHYSLDAKMLIDAFWLTTL